MLNEHDDDRVDSTTGEEDGAVRSVSSLCHGMRAWGKFEPSFQAALLAMPTCHFAKYGMDYWTSATRAGLAPLPISDEKMRKVSCHLAERGKRAAAREGLWRTAFDTLAETHRNDLGVITPLAFERGKRTVSMPAGFFPTLEADLENWRQQAIRPAAHDFDPHRQLTDCTAAAYVEAALREASRLYGNGCFPADGSLKSFASIEVVTKFIEAFGGVLEEAAVFSTLSVWRRIAWDIYGHRSNEAEFVQMQRRGYSTSEKLTTAQLALLQHLLTTEARLKLRNLKAAIWSSALNPLLQQRERLRAANCAVALSIQRELLLRPSDIVGLRIVDGVVQYRARYCDPVDAITLSDVTQEMIRVRGQVRAELGAPPSEYLFPALDGGHQSIVTVDMAFQRIFAAILPEAGPEARLREVTLMVLRDLGAVKLLREDKHAIRRVANILDVNEIRTVRRRYAAFLTGAG